MFLTFFLSHILGTHLGHILGKFREHACWSIILKAIYKSSNDDVTEGADHDEVSKSSVEDTNTNITDNDISGTKTRPPLPLPRRSHRTTKPPQWMRDGEFAINMVCRAMLNAVLDKE